MPRIAESPSRKIGKHDGEVERVRLIEAMELPLCIADIARLYGGIKVNLLSDWRP
jgi:hypothetical protein